ncbi:hypothetical protein LJB71_02790 [Thermomonas sp. S9]|uniref:hypothetical protein n=1 Tax=Thermomonas sp. S9 TaxID=2885203 RepID=UPI00287032DE|nr:hypothetical protein [Thermomonas sp. S9]MCR6495275.1 hypothetical protein [Thermomonas sp. S9]
MRLPSSRQLLVCLALTGAFGPVAAADMRHPAPDSTPPTDPAPAQLDRLDEVDIDGAVAASHPARAPKPKATPALPVRGGGSGDSRMLPSRFHSFLPGMFR